MNAEPKSSQSEPQPVPRPNVDIQIENNACTVRLLTSYVYYDTGVSGVTPEQAVAIKRMLAAAYHQGKSDAIESAMNFLHKEGKSRNT